MNHLSGYMVNLKRTLIWSYRHIILGQFSSVFIRVYLAFTDDEIVRGLLLDRSRTEKNYLPSFGSPISGDSTNSDLLG